MGDILDKIRDWDERPAYEAVRGRNLPPWFRRLEGRSGPVVQMEALLDGGER